MQVRHEESAAFMACAHAKWTGRLGCCLATTGPGGLHLLTGLYDAKLDHAPVLAITGLPYHDLDDTYTQQDVDHTKVFADVAEYSARVMSAAHVENVVSLACRTALARRGVGHVAIPVDVQEQAVAATKRSDRNVAHHTSLTAAESLRLPPDADLDRAAEVLNGATRVAILAGQGALEAREALVAVADALGAPVVKALLGKALLPTTTRSRPAASACSGRGRRRKPSSAATRSSSSARRSRTSSTTRSRARRRACRSTATPSRIGLRFPVEVGLAGDARATLEALLPRLQRKTRSLLPRGGAAGRRGLATPAA